jgi:hypothetical protein
MILLSFPGAFLDSRQAFCLNSWVTNAQKDFAPAPLAGAFHLGVSAY